MVKVTSVVCPNCTAPIKVRGYNFSCSYCGSSLAFENTDEGNVLRSYYAPKVKPGKMVTPLLLEICKIIDSGTWDIQERIVCMHEQNAYGYNLSRNENGEIECQHYINADREEFGVYWIEITTEDEFVGLEGLFKRKYRKVESFLPHQMLTVCTYNVHSGENEVYMGERAVIFVSDAEHQEIAEEIAAEVSKKLKYKPGVQLDRI